MHFSVTVTVNGGGAGLHCTATVSVRLVEVVQCTCYQSIAGLRQMAGEVII